MQRKVVTLDRGAVLWNEGDVAREVGVVEAGRLGVHSERGLVGVLWPGMVVGETALLAESGGEERRTASIQALEDETRVLALPAAGLRDALAGGAEQELGGRVLQTLVGQVCRNLLLTLSARRSDAHLDGPLRGLLRGVVESAVGAQPPSGWESFRDRARFLCDVRRLSESALDSFGPDIAARGDLVESASKLLGEILAGSEAPRGLEDFLSAEREKSEWWARERR